jgi:hypothetical protein
MLKSWGVSNYTGAYRSYLVGLILVFFTFFCLNAKESNKEKIKAL